LNIPKFLYDFRDAYLLVSMKFYAILYTHG
jgi:hypothetical protein